MHSVTRCRLQVAALAVAVVLLPHWTACASAGQRSGRGSSNTVISREEVTELSATNVYEVVEALRPQWLRPRGDLSITQPEQRFPLVYINNLRLGRPEVLRDIQALDVNRIEWIAPADATTRFGTGHAGGVIRVVTRPGTESRD